MRYSSDRTSVYRAICPCSMKIKLVSGKILKLWDAPEGTEHLTFDGERLITPTYRNIDLNDYDNLDRYLKYVGEPTHNEWMNYVSKEFK